MPAEPLPIIIDLGFFWIVAVFLGVQVLGTAFFYGLATLRNMLVSKRRDAELTDAAATLGLESRRETLGMLTAFGWRSGFAVTLDGARGGIRVAIAGSRLPIGFEIWETEPVTVLTGDPAFDHICFPRGRDVEILGRLDAETRSWFARHRATCVDRRLVFHLPLGMADLAAEVERAIGIADRLASTIVSESLGRIASGDPIPATRAAAEDQLTSHLPTSADAKLIFTRWLADPAASARRRLRARIFLEGIPADLDEELLLEVVLGGGGHELLRHLMSLGSASELVLARLLARVHDWQAGEILRWLAENGTAVVITHLRAHAVIPGSATAALLSEAIERIQRRIIGAEKGQLALAAEEARGELTLDERRGAVTVLPPRR